MRVRIVSDGTRTGTRLENAETGELIECVESVEILCSAYDPICRARIVITDLQMDVLTEDVQWDHKGPCPNHPHLYHLSNTPYAAPGMRPRNDAADDAKKEGEV